LKNGITANLEKLKEGQKASTHRLEGRMPDINFLKLQKKIQLSLKNSPEDA